MGKKLRIVMWALGCAIWLTACFNHDDLMPTEHYISPKKAKEDFKEFVEILKKAHPALYAYTPQEKIERISDSLQATITQNISQRELFNLLAQVTEKIACSHTNLYIPDVNLEAIGKQPYFFPYPLTLIEDRLVVNIAGGRLPKGAEIKSINGKSAAEMLRKLSIYNSTDGIRPGLRRYLAANDFGYQYFLQYGPSQTFQVEYLMSDTGTIKTTMELEAITLDELNNRNRNDRYYFDPVDVDYDFYTIDAGSYAVMKVRTFEYESYSKDEAFENFCKNTFTMLQLKPHIKTLVIDIRENEGGNYSNCHLLFSYLAQTAFQEYKQVSTRIKKLPDSKLVASEYSGNAEEMSTLLNDNFYKATNGKYYIADSLNSIINPLPQRFNGKVLVIVNGDVSSAAAYFASLVKNAGRGKIIGEETRGGAYMHNGFRNVVYELPNSKIQFAFSIANVVHSMANKADYGRGVQPDYPKPSTWEDFKKNRDTQLNFIQDSLLNN